MRSRSVRRSQPLRSDDELKRENEALRNRSSNLCAAVLRINASLEVTIVLREVIDSARALIGARYGVITTIDDAGQVDESLFSGFTPEEHERVVRWPAGMRLFEHLRGLPGALRLSDLAAYVQSLGHAPAPAWWSTPFPGTSMHHRGAHVGLFFLAAKEGGGEFTSEDEEILVLFASQAAAAIANARTHRNERRARADLEALVETSPVGVVVFDARTGSPKSLNREARRIVEGLLAPGRPAEELLDVATFRRAGGPAIALEEFPLARHLSHGETVRAEEIVLTVPDGRSVTTLVNVTPIPAADGRIELVVVTMQDLAPLEELERLRTEFLGMVGHELRAPLTSIKGSAATVLNASQVLDPAEMLQFFRIIDEQADQMRGLISDLLDAGRIETARSRSLPSPRRCPAWWSRPAARS